MAPRKPPRPSTDVTTSEVQIARCVAETDRDWAMVNIRSSWKPETGAEIREQERAETRITKRVANVLKPPGWKLEVRRGRGTGRHWVKVVWTPPEVLSDYGIQFASALVQRTRRLLKIVGIRFGQYYTDYGGDIDGWEPKLSVTYRVHP